MLIHSFSYAMTTSLMSQDHPKLSNIIWPQSQWPPILRISSRLRDWLIFNAGINMWRMSQWLPLFRNCTSSMWETIFAEYCWWLFQRRKQTCLSRGKFRSGFFKRESRLLGFSYYKRLHWKWINLAILFVGKNWFRLCITGLATKFQTISRILSCNGEHDKLLKSATPLRFPR